MTTTEILIASMEAILRNNNLNELQLGDTDELTEPTNIVWYDKNGCPYDDRVTGVFIEDGELALEVEASQFSHPERIYRYDFAFTNPDWLQNIRDNMLEVLQQDGRRRCPACGKVLTGENKYCSDECRRQECQPDLNRYYRENKDTIHSSIKELAYDLAVGRLMNAHGRPFKAFVEPDDPGDPKGGTHYKEAFQEEFDRYYDEEYDRIADLMKFDSGAEDGIRDKEPEGDIRPQSTPDNPFAALVSRAHVWQREAREQIVETLRKHGGRVTFTPEDENGEYPVTSLLYGKHDFPRIDLTDVYLDEEEHGTYIMADGIDSITGEKRTGFQIYDEQLYDIALFLKYVL